jgi:hypothetical protein
MDFSFPRWIIEGVEDKAVAKRILSAYYEGVLHGQWKYSWMKDGVTYVGTTGTLKKEADAQVTQEKERALTVIDAKFK